MEIGNVCPERIFCCDWARLVLGRESVGYNATASPDIFWSKDVHTIGMCYCLFKVIGCPLTCTLCIVAVILIAALHRLPTTR
jgi:hypothetical protein